MSERTPEEQEAIRQAMSIIGRSKSAGKAAASKENGQKGGAHGWSEESRKKQAEAQRARWRKKAQEKEAGNLSENP